ncbi:MAG: Ppx/GppA family phosphatase, partial [Coriobacteriia bacterium]|nr:Ppx/GppA family phosphatase [Coriobacteriia bacterium]
DLWLKSDPPLLSELNDARDWLVLQTKAFLDDFKSSGLAIDQVFAVAGTPTTLVAIRDKLAVYDPSHVHGQVVTLQQWQTVFDKLSAMPLQQRSQVVGLEPERAPIMVGGIMILDHIMHALELPKVTVSESDILQGVLLDTWRQSASPSPSIP